MTIDRASAETGRRRGAVETEPSKRARRVRRAIVALAIVVTSGAGLVAGPAATAGAAVGETSTGRFGLPLSVDAYSPAAQQILLHPVMSSASRWALSVLARYPTANWYGNLTPAFTTELVSNRVHQAALAHTVAQLVVFNLPHRGCDGTTEAGPQTAAEYRTWFDAFMRGLGTHRAIVIMEPDALGLASCLSPALRLERYQLISWAVAKLHRQGSWSYIDIGHSGWLSVATAAHRLRMSNIAQATGFSLNESNFRPDSELIPYGAAISKLVGGRHFVIDSSRNGVAPKSGDTAFCNAPDKGLGHAPSESTGVPRLDAYLWIKVPGQSDGTCNGGPSAGAWWQSYALMLVKNRNLG